MDDRATCRAGLSVNSYVNRREQRDDAAAGPSNSGEESQDQDRGETRHVEGSHCHLNLAASSSEPIGGAIDPVDGGGDEAVLARAVEQGHNVDDALAIEDRNTAGIEAPEPPLGRRVAYRRQLANLSADDAVG